MVVENIELDDIFKEDADDICFNFNYELPIHNSAISNKLTLDFSTILKLKDRVKANAGVQANYSDKVIEAIYQSDYPSIYSSSLQGRDKSDLDNNNQIINSSSNVNLGIYFLTSQRKHETSNLNLSTLDYNKKSKIQTARKVKMKTNRNFSINLNSIKKNILNQSTLKSRTNLDPLFVANLSYLNSSIQSISSLKKSLLFKKSSISEGLFLPQIYT